MGGQEGAVVLFLSVACLWKNKWTEGRVEFVESKPMGAIEKNKIRNG